MLPAVVHELHRPLADQDVPAPGTRVLAEIETRVRYDLGGATT